MVLRGLACWVEMTTVWGLGFHRTVSLRLVLDSDLGLAIRTQPPQLTTLAHVCEVLPRRVAMEWVKGIISALIAGTDIHLLLADVHIACNV